MGRHGSSRGDRKKSSSPPQRKHSGKKTKQGSPTTKHKAGPKTPKKASQPNPHRQQQQQQTPAPRLQDHQLAIRDYFVRDCCKLPGVLLFHGVGTGKTLTALSVVMSLSSRRGVIFCPDNLAFMWRAEIEKYASGQQQHQQEITVHSLDDMAKVSVRDAVVVVDEAHFWLEALFNEKRRREASAAFKNLASAYRRVILTASPIISIERGMFDMACLVNLAAGRSVFPFAFHDFKRQLIAVSQTDVFIGGWVAPILQMVLGVYHQTVFRYSVIMPLEQRVAMDMFGIDSRGKDDGKNADKGNIEGPPLSSDTNDTKAADPDTRPKKRTWAGWFRSWIPYGKIHIVELLWRTYVTGPIYRKTLEVAHGLDRVNISKFMQACQGHCSVLPVPKDTGDFPTMRHLVAQVDLTEDQYLAWKELADKVTDSQTLKDLGIINANKTNEEVGLDLAYHSTAALTYMDYLRNGRRLGLLGDAPPKLVRMLRLMRQVGFRRCVVYSEFESTAPKVRAFLARHAPQDVQILELSTDLDDRARARVLDAFAASQRSVLLLHPDLYYGITVRGASQLHVLEPPIDMTRKTQLFGRVVRYRSHAHLQPEERHVDIVIYVSRVSDEYANLVNWVTGAALPSFQKMFKAELRHYLKHESQMAPFVLRRFKRETRKSQPTHMAPDSVIMDMVQHTEHALLRYLHDSAHKHGDGGLVPTCPSQLACPESAHRHCATWSPDNNNNNNKEYSNKRKRGTTTTTSCDNLLHH